MARQLLPFLMRGLKRRGQLERARGTLDLVICRSPGKNLSSEFIFLANEFFLRPEEMARSARSPRWKRLGSTQDFHEAHITEPSFPWPSLGCLPTLPSLLGLGDFSGDSDREQ